MPVKCHRYAPREICPVPRLKACFWVGWPCFFFFCGFFCVLFFCFFFFFFFFLGCWVFFFLLVFAWAKDQNVYPHKNQDVCFFTKKNNNSRRTNKWRTGGAGKKNLITVFGKNNMKARITWIFRKSPSKKATRPLDLKKRQPSPHRKNAHNPNEAPGEKRARGKARRPLGGWLLFFFLKKSFKKKFRQCENNGI